VPTRAMSFRTFKMKFLTNEVALYNSEFGVHVTFSSLKMMIEIS
jgi:hypothetical protein